MERCASAKKISLEMVMDIACSTKIKDLVHERTTVQRTTTNEDPVWIQKLKYPLDTLDIWTSLSEWTSSSPGATLSAKTVTAQYLSLYATKVLSGTLGTSRPLVQPILIIWSMNEAFYYKNCKKTFLGVNKQRSGIKPVQDFVARMSLWPETPGNR